MIEKLIQKSKNITASGRSDIKPAWIAQTQRRLGFALPASYKQMLLRYASVSAAGTELKTIAPPEFADSADEGICYTYEVNLKNGLFAADELVFLQLEEYYFKISLASDIADGSPNTARGKTAESMSGEVMGETVRDTVIATVSDGAKNRAPGDEARAERSPDAARDMNAGVVDETTCKTAGATTSETAGDAASGAMKEIASERADDAPCEYKVYVRDYAEGEDRLLRTIFTGFWKNFKTKFNAKSGAINGTVWHF